MPMRNISISKHYDNTLQVSNHYICTTTSVNPTTYTPPPHHIPIYTASPPTNHTLPSTTTNQSLPTPTTSVIHPTPHDIRYTTQHLHQISTVANVTPKNNVTMQLTVTLFHHAETTNMKCTRNLKDQFETTMQCYSNTLEVRSSYVFATTFIDPTMYLTHYFIQLQQ